MPLRFRRIN